MWELLSGTQVQKISGIDRNLNSVPDPPLMNSAASRRVSWIAVCRIERKTPRVNSRQLVLVFMCHGKASKSIDPSTADQIMGLKSKRALNFLRRLPQKRTPGGNVTAEYRRRASGTRQNLDNSVRAAQ